VDALWDRQHPSHFSVADALGWIERLGTRQAVLTNMHSDLDYDELSSRLPAHVIAGYDGIRMELPES
jgi:phosphoribosyl 1,2-cyclic phosphate phosphodiesterase